LKAGLQTCGAIFHGDNADIIRESAADGKLADFIEDLIEQLRGGQGCAPADGHRNAWPSVKWISGAFMILNAVPVKQDHSSRRELCFRDLIAGIFDKGQGLLAAAGGVDKLNYLPILTLQVQRFGMACIGIAHFAGAAISHEVESGSEHWGAAVLHDFK